MILLSAFILLFIAFIIAYRGNKRAAVYLFVVTFTFAILQFIFHMTTVLSLSL
jgi:heme/copper-type cytochrome/quinol oxidase subunit 4